MKFEILISQLPLGPCFDFLLFQLGFQMTFEIRDLLKKMIWKIYCFSSDDDICRNGGIYIYI